MDPKRLLKEGDAFERELLRSAQRDVVPAKSRSAIIGALGVGAAAPPAVVALETLTEASPNPAPMGSPNVVQPPSPPIAPPVAPIVGGKGLLAAAGAAVTGAAVWAGVTLSQSPAPPPTPPTEVAEMAPAPEPTAPPVEEAPAPAPPKVEQPAKPRVKRTSQSKPSANETSDALVRELALIERARRALRDDDPSLALRRLDAYNAEFPKGSLKTEQTVLRIEALAASGNHATATRLGRAFLKRSPNGPYARRVRSLLGDAPDRTKQ